MAALSCAPHLPDLAYAVASIRREHVEPFIVVEIEPHRRHPPRDLGVHSPGELGPMAAGLAHKPTQTEPRRSPMGATCRTQ
jgi:hypothetical protein